jgi:hypothetical protein
MILGYDSSVTPVRQVPIKAARANAENHVMPA